ncbi:MAG TPA: hypothetical protein PKG48_03420 [Bacteroidales bacterium]|nr:hypothetical protein [Bacteroidales bacterium]HPS63526.1 hypothetical protein [Bacteroidales bacterium]
MKTICSIHKVLRYKGHVIRAEKRSVLYGMEYSLIIDDVKQDQINGLYGLLVMHGKISEEGSILPVKVLMKQRILTTGFFCKVGDEIFPMETLRFDELR